MLDENSSLIVEIIGLNNQIKHGKGTNQLSEITEKLDKKRKKLNKNLMTLAKWADESSDNPRPTQTAYIPQPSQPQYVQQNVQMVGVGGSQMSMNPAAKMQLPRYGAPTAQVQAQAMAHAQYQARMASMGPQQAYGGGIAGTAPGQRYVDPSVAYGGGTTTMGGPVSGYNAGPGLGYRVATSPGYNMMAPQGAQLQQHMIPSTQEANNK